MNKARIRYGVMAGKKAIIIELLTEDNSWSLESMFPIENFNKNELLPQFLINRMWNLQHNGYNIKYEFVEIEDE